MNDFKSGAVDKKYDARDVPYSVLNEKLGKATKLPRSYKSKSAEETAVHFQGSYPDCSAHAGTHAMQTLESKDKGVKNFKGSPYYGWKKIKSFDGYANEVGTDLRSLLKWLADFGVCEHKLMPKRDAKDLDEYSEDTTTFEQNLNASYHKVKTYGFMGNNREQIKQAIYDNGTAVLLLRFGSDWWGSKTMSSNGDSGYGHFVEAYGWTESDSLLIKDSTDKKIPFKILTTSFNIRDSGAVTDVPYEEVQTRILLRAALQRIVVLLRELLSKK